MRSTWTRESGAGGKRSASWGQHCGRVQVKRERRTDDRLASGLDQLGQPGVVILHFERLCRVVVLEVLAVRHEPELLAVSADFVGVGVEDL